METLNERIKSFLTVCYGYGSGSGDGYGSGSGDGYGYGVIMFNGFPVYMIDGVATIIKAIYNNFAKGCILNRDLTLTPCYIAKNNKHFAHGFTLAEAIKSLHDKVFEDMDEDERISEFWKCHTPGVEYPAMDFFEWHHKLTGSCEAGRKSFAADHGVNLETDTYTPEEFVKMCGKSYGGYVIRKLLESEG